MHEQMERLYEAAKKLKGITGQSNLARFMNESPQTVKNWESRGVSKKGMISAQKILGCDAAWIETGEGDINSFFADEDKNIDLPPDGSGRVPLISWVQAGNWKQIFDNFGTGDSDEWLSCPVKHGKNTFCLSVVGESMANKDTSHSFEQGEIIFVDPDVQPVSGSFVVANTGNAEATFKQYIEEDGRKCLKAINPAWNPKYIDLTESMSICGVVIGKFSKI